MMLNKNASLVVLMAMALLGCNPPPESPQELAKNAPEMTFGTPTFVVAMGKTKATEQFITRKWQVVSMNDAPVSDNLILDMTDFRNGKGEFSDGCERILVEFNTNDLSNERLLIDHSVRQESNCSSETIEEVMWVLSDVYAFERQGQDLNIIAVQDKIHLKPLN